MSAHLAAYSAIGLSVISMLICMVTVPKLAFMISDISDQLDQDMDEFKALENGIYAQYRTKASEAIFLFYSLESVVSDSAILTACTVLKAHM
jgi:hypothetical protein